MFSGEKYHFFFLLPSLYRTAESPSVPPSPPPESPAPGRMRNNNGMRPSPKKKAAIVAITMAAFFLVLSK